MRAPISCASCNDWLPRNTLKHALLMDLRSQLEGELEVNDLYRVMYSTDASAYREVPLAVAFPANADDARTLVKFAGEHLISLVPRGGGTSLAGQVVGNGIVVDVSRHMNSIVEIDVEGRTARVQPGLIRDELNLALRPHGLFFAPETSTSNRATIGGMIGNNACGVTSLWFGSTRDHLREASAVLSDGERHVFGPLENNRLHALAGEPGIAGNVCKCLLEMLSSHSNQESIRRGFPKASIERRNTGYALDALISMSPFSAHGPVLNLCSLLAGSEGTLAFITEALVDLSPLPPSERGLLCVHFKTLRESLLAARLLPGHKPYSVELVDHHILECTKANIEQRRNRFFVEGDPAAILLIEIAADSASDMREKARAIEKDLRSEGLGTHFPVITGSDISKVSSLRKAGLGLLQNLPGDAKAVPVIEDTAVAVEDLADYVADFGEILKRYNLSAVHYGHVLAGELHLRPILDLKTKKGQELFRTIAVEIACLVKKYGGSLSGEHGDGRLRGEFLPMMLGEKNYEMLRTVKEVFDPKLIFNPGKIVDTPPMDSSLRFDAAHGVEPIETVFHFRKEQGILRAAELCNGSGDCRKTAKLGGVMCPSYMTTRDEKDTTRARANILREFLSNSAEVNKFNHDEIREVMELCISCKGCKSECPSNVDIARLKAEFLQHFYDSRGTPLRARLIGNYATILKAGSHLPWLSNLILGSKLLSYPVRALIGMSPHRKFPVIPARTFRAWFSRREFEGRRLPYRIEKKGKVCLFCDEFTDYLDVAVGRKTVELLESLGYEVELAGNRESGRSALSKGLVRRAVRLGEENVKILAKTVSEGVPVIGIEPSAILTLRDEYPDLVSDGLLPQAERVAANSLLLEEFLVQEAFAGRITVDQFTEEPKKIYLHGHCYQKALGSVQAIVTMLSFPRQYEAEVIPSGCCGMAGFFGYEKEHYDTSMAIGELVLFPAVRALPEDAVIAAAGTSCRAQLLDGTGRSALHPAEILWDAVRKE